VISTQQFDWSPQNLARWCRTCQSSGLTVKNVILKTRDARRLICKRHILRLSPFWILKLKFLIAIHFRHVLHHHAKFCGDTHRSYCCTDIAIFPFFISISVSILSTQLSSVPVWEMTTDVSDVSRQIETSGTGLPGASPIRCEPFIYFRWRPPASRLYQAVVLFGSCHASNLASQFKDQIKQQKVTFWEKEVAFFSTNNLSTGQIWSMFNTSISERGVTKCCVPL